MQGENGSIDPLRFVGERNKPLLPEEIAQIRPELGSGERKGLAGEGDDRRDGRHHKWYG